MHNILSNLLLFFEVYSSSSRPASTPVSWPRRSLSLCFWTVPAAGSPSLSEPGQTGCWRTNGIRLNVQGLENLEERHSYILISNHMSILDIPGIISALPFPVRFIAKRSLIWFPIFGWSLYLSRHILIDRDNPHSALKSLKQAASLLKSGISIMVFPGGDSQPGWAGERIQGGSLSPGPEGPSPGRPGLHFGNL